MCVSRSCRSRCCRLPGAELYPVEGELVPGGGKGSLTLVLLVVNGHLALGHHHSGNNSVAGLVKPGSEGKRFLLKTD